MSEQTSPAAQNTQLDVMNGVYRGLPKSFETHGVYEVSSIPHVHAADLSIMDRDGSVDHAPGMVNVFVAHGFEDSQSGEWVLKDGRSVEEVIDGYNQTYPDEPIQFAAVCSPGSKLGRKLKGSVGHAAGSSVQVSGMRDIQDGHLDLMVSLQDPDRGVWYLPRGNTTRLVLQ